jgi:spore coat protein U-like protein
MCTRLRAGNQPVEHRPWLTSLFAAIAIAVCSLAIGPLQAEAGTATGNLTVQLTITSSCTIGAATLNFGSDAGTSLLTTALTANTTVSVTCTNLSPYSIGMGQGSNYSSTNRMANGANYIGYGLYTDSALTHPWTTASSSTTCTVANGCYLGTGNGSAQSVPIYGQVPTVATAPAPGSYSDTVVMTITY